MLSRSIHVAANYNITFFFMSELYSIVYIFVCVYIYIYVSHIFLSLSSVDGHLGCFHALAIVNSAAMNIGVHVAFDLEFSFFGY